MPALQLRSDRRRLPERDGRLARHRRGVRRQRANGARRIFVSVDSSRRSGSHRSLRKRNRISSDQHPQWFIKDADGAPLRSDRVTFGGWRRGPWYALDGTHPEAQIASRTRVPDDANRMGLHLLQARRQLLGRDARRTVPRRARDTRRGLPPRHGRPIVRGAGDSFLLGCNHPMWPSLGLIHGSRSSNDIKRTWDRIKTTGISEPAAQLAERASVVERSGCDCAGERSDRCRVSVSRVRHLCERRDGAVRRRFDEAAAGSRRDAQKTPAADRRRRGFRRRLAPAWNRDAAGSRACCACSTGTTRRSPGRFACGAACGHRLLDR